MGCNLDFIKFVFSPADPWEDHLRPLILLLEHDLGVFPITVAFHHCEMTVRLIFLRLVGLCLTVWLILADELVYLAENWLQRKHTHSG